MQDKFRERFESSYPYENLSRLFTKTTVSELKREKMTDDTEGAYSLFEETERDVCIPRFMREEEELTGASRGNAFHRVMELLELKELFGDCKPEERSGLVQAQMEAMVLQERLTAEYMACVPAEKICRFLDSSLAERMYTADCAGNLHREQPFMLGIPADEVEECFPGSETVLIQGIIDIYLEEKDGLVVADYKTDAVHRPEELAERYRLQLDYYARALETITGKKVKEKIIYSFRLEKEIMLK